MDSSIKTIAAAQPRQEPTLGAASAETKVEVGAEMDMDTIHSVIALARRVAKQNYEEHLEAARNAKSREELEAAIAAATRAFEATNSMRVAQSYFDTAEGNIQLGGLRFMQGKEKEAESSFTAAGAHIRTAAGKIDDFSKYVMQSSFMERAIAVVAKADDVKSVAVEKATGAYAAFEQSAVRTAEGFSRGLKSFSERMVEFGHKVAAAPQQIRDITRQKAVSAIEATSAVVTGFLSRVKKAAQKVSKAISDKHDAIDAKANALDRKLDAKLEVFDARVADGIDRVKEEARQAWNTLEQHARAAHKAGVDLADRAKAGGQEVALNAHAAASTAASIGRSLRAVLASEFVSNKEKLASARQAKP